MAMIFSISGSQFVQTKNDRMDPAEFEETEAHSSNSLGPGLELLCFLL
jgi:hypothetical protein